MSVTDHIKYGLCVNAYKYQSLQGTAPKYLSNLCTLVAQALKRHLIRHLWRHTSSFGGIMVELENHTIACPALKAHLSVAAAGIG